MNEYNDAWNDSSAKVFVRHVIDELVPKVKASHVIVSMAPMDGTGDVKFWVELGASIMMDKPIIAVVFGDREIPEKLRLVADEVVVLQDGVNPAAAIDVADAIHRVTDKLASDENS